MQISLSSKLALLATAGASVSAENYLPTTHVRSLGLRAVEIAHEKATAGRRMQGQGGDDLLLDENSLLAAMGPMMCSVFEDPDLIAELDDEMETLGISCSKIGCDDPNAQVPNLIMNCYMDAETCDEDPSGGKKFCIEKTEVRVSMGLNFVGKSKIESTQCGDYTSPQYMKDLGRGCWSVDMTMNFGAYITDIVSGNVEIDEYTTDEEIMMNYFKFDKCSSEFDNDTTICSCGLCNEGKGFQLTCDNDLVSEECTAFDLAVTDTLDMDSYGGSDGLSAPNVSIMRMLPSNEKASKVEEKEVENQVDEAKAANDLESSATFQEKAMAIGLAGLSVSLALFI